MVPERWVYNVLPEDELKVSRLNFSSHARCRHMTVGQRAMAVAITPEPTNVWSDAREFAGRAPVAAVNQNHVAAFAADDERLARG
jgi:hypothetical protein